MSVERKEASRRDETDVQRYHVTTRYTPHSTLPFLSTTANNTSLPSSSSTSPHPRSSWTQLPADIWPLIVGYASFRGLLHAALVDHRLYHLIVEAVPSASQQCTIWQHHSPAVFEVRHHDRGWSSERAIRVGRERFEGRHRDAKYVSSLLSVLRHITELHLVFDHPWPHHSLDPWYADVDTRSPALFSSLHLFKQLRSLEVRGVPANWENRYIHSLAALATALDSLPSLTNLELGRLDKGEFEEWQLLRQTLHRLGSSQLDHLTIDQLQLLVLVTQEPRLVMSHLRSLTVHSAGNESTLRRLGVSFSDQFPSLLHLNVSCEHWLNLATCYLPPLSSFTIHCVGLNSRWTRADVSYVNTRTLCFRPPVDDKSFNIRDKMRSMLMHPPAAHIQQLSLCDSRVVRKATDRSSQLFPPAGAAALSALSNLTYLDFIDGLTLVDLTYLLNDKSPPIFAAQLTHLALGVHWMDRADAATLLLSLPSMYPSLTHVYIGVQGKRNKEQLVECTEWDVAVQTVRAAVGLAWCASMADVIVCREDVAWRLSAGLPVYIWHPSHRGRYW